MTEDGEDQCNLSMFLEQHRTVEGFAMFRLLNSCMGNSSRYGAALLFHMGAGRRPPAPSTVE